MPTEERSTALGEPIDRELDGTPSVTAVAGQTGERATRQHSLVPPPPQVTVDPITHQGIAQGESGLPNAGLDVGHDNQVNPSARHGFASEPPLPEFREWSQTYALDILDKQYRLYSWNDAKSLSLITTNSMLLAAIGFLFKDCLQDTLSTILVSIGLLLTSLSLCFSLLQVVPQGSSGKSGSEPNLRALRSICTHKTWQKYVAEFCRYTNQQAIADTVRQIYGMAHNNDESRKKITSGVKLTLASLLFIFLTAISVAFAAKGISPLGKWTAPPTSQASHPQTSNNLPIGAAGQLGTRSQSPHISKVAPATSPASVASAIAPPRGIVTPSLTKNSSKGP